MTEYKLGSLFDGSGGFPLAGALCGIRPVWASEVEPYPIAVTKSRFPKMKHLGDISKINGAEVEPVDIITFGSPCQDLSVAGKRAGLKHTENGDEETTRSGLFMEAVRIIKEMRKATDGEYPKYCVWENVPGAFSSNRGNDFRIVCEELIKIVEPTATMPEVPQKGWNYADSYVGDGWSLAYRVLDAQYWGVPQRRRRIYLVADFRGGRAREILFEREGLRGYFTQGRTPWQTTPADAQGGPGADDREGEGFDRYNQCLTGNISETLRTPNGGDNYACVVERGRQLDDVAYTLKIRSGCEGGGKGALVQKNKSATLATNNDQYLFQPVTDTHILDDQGGSVMNVRTDGKAPTIRAQMGGHPPVVMVLSAGFCPEQSEKTRGIGYEEENAPTLRAGVTPGVVYGIENHPADSRVNLDESGKVQTLTSRMGTGGGNVPMVMEPKAFEWHNQDTRIRGPIDTACTLSTNAGGREGHLVMEPKLFEFHGQDVRLKGPLDVAPTAQAGYGEGGSTKPLVVEEVPVICLQGNGIDRADTAGCNGKGWKEDTAYTLNTIDRPAVAYGLDRASFNQGQNAKFDFLVTEEHQPTLTARGPGAVAQPIYNASKASFFMRATENGTADTLVATDYKDPQLVAYQDTVGSLCASDYKGIRNQDIGEGKAIVQEMPHGTRHYIVRRLTPTECARLQGFADRWGDIEALDRLSAKDYQFWKEVRNTHAAINGKKVQDYNVKQMLAWYNKLQTDSSEYKMWGNGIALPTALYVLQGLADALDADDYSVQLTMSAVEEDDSWMY